MKSPRVQFEHPTQLAASAFLRALSEGDAATAWEHLSRETRGLLEGLYAARNAVALHRAAVVAALGVDRLGGFGVSGARVVDRNTAYVLLLPEFGDERIVAEADWKPSHLLAFVHESREWLVDLGRTATLSAEADLPDPLGAIRR